MEDWYDGTLLTQQEIEKRSKQAAVVSTKSTKATAIPSPYDPPWRIYGKKDK